MPIFDPRERSFPILPTLIISNILPLIGILYYDLTFFSLFYLYWWETVIISFFTFMKMGRAQQRSEPDPNYTVNGKTLTNEQVNSKRYMRTSFAVIRFFMLVFYLIFIVIFVGLVSAAKSDDDILSFGGTLFFIYPWMRISFAAFLITHTLEYWIWVRDEEYKTTSLRALGSPFDSRIVIMHIVIVLGTFLSFYASENLFPGNPKAGSMGYAILFVMMKTGVDMFAYMKNTKRTEVIRALQPRKTNKE